MAFDFKKELKEFYMAKNKPEIIKVPKANYLAVRGKGDPNEEGGAYQQAIGVLYAVAYTLKMSYKTEHKIEGFLSMSYRPSRDSGGRIMWRVSTIPTNLHLTGFPRSAFRILLPARILNGP